MPRLKRCLELIYPPWNSQKHLKLGLLPQKENNLPIIHLQMLLLLVSGKVGDTNDCTPCRHGTPQFWTIATGWSICHLWITARGRFKPSSSCWISTCGFVDVHQENFHFDDPNLPPPRLCQNFNKSILSYLLGFFKEFYCCMIPHVIHSSISEQLWWICKPSQRRPTALFGHWTPWRMWLFSKPLAQLWTLWLGFFGQLNMKDYEIQWGWV